MSKSDIETLIHVIKTHWPNAPSEKARRYIGQFFNTTRLGTKIAGQVVGNHGTYTVSIQSDEQRVSSACSCYIGKHGYCHHCHALALTFLDDPQDQPKQGNPVAFLLRRARRSALRVGRVSPAHSLHAQDQKWRF